MNNEIRFQWHVANELHKEDPHNFKPWDLYEMLRGLDFDHDAAAFITEWCPEYEPVIREIYATPYSWMTARQHTEDEWTAQVDWYGETEEYIEENYGTIFRDTAFDGVIYIGE